MLDLCFTSFMICLIRFFSFSVHSRHQGGGDISTGTRNGRGRAPGRGRGRGRGRGKNQPGEKSVDELDKELESYHAEAMQT